MNVAVFRELDRVSEAGTTVNEDATGIAGAFAWIIDGASGISDTLLTPGPSDAAWLARHLDRTLAGNLDILAGHDVAGALAALQASLTEQFAREGTYSPDDPDHLGPSGALGLLRATPADGDRVHVEAGFLADVVALVPREDGIVRWTDERAKAFEAKTLALVRKYADRRDGGLPEEVRLQIAENRTWLNREDGYWAVHPLRDWAGHALAFSAEVAPGAPIVLASDGFMRLVDVFSSYDDAGLYDEVLRRGAPALLDELRGLEDRDPAMRDYPRAKVRDDATVMIVAPTLSQSI